MKEVERRKKDAEGKQNVDLIFFPFFFVVVACRHVVKKSVRGGCCGEYDTNFANCKNSWNSIKKRNMRESLQNVKEEARQKKKRCFPDL